MVYKLEFFQATRVMDCVARQVRSRKGAEAATDFRGRWKHEVGIAIQRRKAAMLRAVLPRPPGRQGWLASGGHQREGTGVLPPLEEDEEEEEEVEDEEQQEQQ